MEYLVICGDSGVAAASRGINVAWRFMKMSLAREIHLRFEHHIEHNAVRRETVRLHLADFSSLL